ncbi:hypothetical protein HDV05_003015 [Chytridiales sp. JEL 0842]|nr:hypothetical protein HDV05_003015 [Chytridiales sp. JEL 0842]
MAIDIHSPLVTRKGAPLKGNELADRLINLHKDAPRGFDGMPRPNLSLLARSAQYEAVSKWITKRKLKDRRRTVKTADLYKLDSAWTSCATRHLTCNYIPTGKTKEITLHSFDAIVEAFIMHVYGTRDFAAIEQNPGKPYQPFKVKPAAKAVDVEREDPRRGSISKKACPLSTMNWQIGGRDAKREAIRSHRHTYGFDGFGEEHAVSPAIAKEAGILSNDEIYDYKASDKGLLKSPLVVVGSDNAGEFYNWATELNDIRIDPFDRKTPNRAKLSANMVTMEVIILGWPYHFLVSLCNIRPGEELLLDYGSNYWKVMRDHRADIYLVDNELKPMAGVFKRMEDISFVDKVLSSHQLLQERIVTLSKNLKPLTINDIRIENLRKEVAVLPDKLRQMPESVLSDIVVQEIDKLRQDVIKLNQNCEEKENAVTSVALGIYSSLEQFGTMLNSVSTTLASCSGPERPLDVLERFHDAGDTVFKHWLDASTNAIAAVMKLSGDGCGANKKSVTDVVHLAPNKECNNSSSVPASTSSTSIPRTFSESQSDIVHESVADRHNFTNVVGGHQSLRTRSSNGRFITRKQHISDEASGCSGRRGRTVAKKTTIKRHFYSSLGGGGSSDNRKEHEGEGSGKKRKLSSTAQREPYKLRKLSNTFAMESCTTPFLIDEPMIIIDFSEERALERTVDNVEDIVRQRRSVLKDNPSTNSPIIPRIRLKSNPPPASHSGTTMTAQSAVSEVRARTLQSESSSSIVVAEERHNFNLPTPTPSIATRSKAVDHALSSVVGSTSTLLDEMPRISVDPSGSRTSPNQPLAAKSSTNPIATPALPSISAKKRRLPFVSFSQTFSHNTAPPTPLSTPILHHGRASSTQCSTSPLHLNYIHRPPHIVEYYSLLQHSSFPPLRHYPLLHFHCPSSPSPAQHPSPPQTS